MPKRKIDKRALSVAASEFGRRGGLKGGKSRMASLTSEERKALASEAGKASAASLTAEERRARALKASHARRMFKKKK